MNTGYRAGEPIAVALMFDLFSLRGQIFLGDLSEDRIYCLNEAREITIEEGDQLPIRVDMGPGDRLAAGALKMRGETGSEIHYAEDIGDR